KNVRPPCEAERAEHGERGKANTGERRDAQGRVDVIRDHVRKARADDDRRDQERSEDIKDELRPGPLPLRVEDLCEHQLASPAVPAGFRAERSSSTKLSSRSRSITSRSSLSAALKYSRIAGCHPRTTHSSSRPAVTPRLSSVKGREPPSTGGRDTRSRLMPPRNAVIGISAINRPPSITPT